MSDERPDQPGTPPEPDATPGAADAPPADGSGTDAADAAPSGEGAPDAPPTCAECGSPLTDDQTYCLVCGAPTSRAPRLRKRGSPAALVAALAVFGLGAGGLAFAVSRDDSGTSTRPVTATGPSTVPLTTGTQTGPTTGPLPTDTGGIVPTSTGTVTTSTTGTDTQTGFQTVTSGSTFPTTGALPTDTGGGFTDTSDTSDTSDTGSDTGSITETEATLTSQWPTGTQAWTAIIASARDEQAARDVRSQARDLGYGARILLSDDHPDLTPGLYVVFVGVFQAKARAVAQVGRLQGDFPGAYPRYIT